MDSLFGTNFRPMIVTVTPAVDWHKLNGMESAEMEAAVPTFLLRHRDLDRTVEVLSAQ